MHIIIGFITALAGLIWALHSLQNAGLDLNAFNPFAWARRRRWQKHFGVKPIHSLTDSMEAAALLVISIAKVDGDVTRDMKMDILSIFEEEFGINQQRATEIYTSLSYMLQDIHNIDADIKNILAPSKSSFQEAHIQKLLTMLNKVSTLEGGATAQQTAIIHSIQTELGAISNQPKDW